MALVTAPVVFDIEQGRRDDPHVLNFQSDSKQFGNINDFYFFFEKETCGECTIVWITENPLYNDYLPDGVAEHSDDYPEVGMVGYPFYKKLEFTADETPSSWSVVAGSLPPGLTIDSTTLEITGTIAGTCYLDDDNVPFNQWFLNKNEWREADPIPYTFTIKPDCSDITKEWELPVFPDWNPYRESLLESIPYFEKSLIIKERIPVVSVIDKTGLCPPCGTEEIVTSKRLNTLKTTTKYQHGDMYDRFTTESTCAPFQLTENDTKPDVEIQEEITLYRKKSKVSEIDKSGLCNSCEDDDASST